MAQVTNVSGTAFVVAEFRAEENDEAYPLYRDPIVKLFLSEESRQAADRIAAGFPLVKEMVKIRTRYYDDMLQKQISLGCQQVVLLGAGLDTRAVRKPAAGVTYFEIDDSATLTLKQARYEENGIHANVRFIPGNYVTDGLTDLLNKNGFDFDLPTYLIWEGNTMYLTEEIAMCSWRMMMFPGEAWKSRYLTVETIRIFWRDKESYGFASTSRPVLHH